MPTIIFRVKYKIFKHDEENFLEFLINVFWLEAYSNILMVRRKMMMNLDLMSLINSSESPLDGLFFRNSW